MAKEKDKDVKTNAMRILETLGISFEVITYECDEFIDGVHLADKLGQPRESTFKTLVAVGKSGGYFAFVIPVEEELDLKAAARAVGEKSVELIHVKDITKVTGYVRGGCTAIGMKKDYPTVIDETCILFDEIMVSGGRLGSQMKL
ncbi:MAG: aminoacyl-tRNA deacylase, partial [Clostridia bacterium]|nr:aminoacyl-tRNA deacylase [Clostridia bacterium]